MYRSPFSGPIAGLAVVLAACGGGDTSPTANNPPPQPPPVATIAITPGTANTRVGGTITFAAVLRDDQGRELAGRTITWSSDAANVATVNTGGVATSVAVGSARITATSEGKSAVAILTVDPIPVAAAVVSPTLLTVVIGRTAALSAEARDDLGGPLAGRTVTWSSSAEAVATVSGTGVVTALSLGAATITATIEGRTAAASITVVPVPVASVTVAPDTAVLKLAETRQFVATVKDDLGNVLTGRRVRWSTSSPSVARVDTASGVVDGEDDGTATITATVEGRSASAGVRVYSPVASVQVVLALDTLEAHDVRQMQATLRDARGRVLSGRTVDWVVSDASIASLSPAGTLTGLDRGTVRVTATSEGISGSATRVVVIRYRSLSVGTMHACDLASGGIAWCWGLNGNEGRIGMAALGVNASSAIPVPVPGGHRFAQLSTFGRHACAVTVQGAAYCWGYQGAGALGNPVGAFSATPVPVSGGLTFRQVAAGSEHSCGLDLAGRAWCWGQNQSGELGDGTRTARTTPVAVSGGLRFGSISAGAGTTCAVATDAALYCWGANALGQLGAGGALGGTSTIPSRVVGGLAGSQVSVGQQYACTVTVAGQGFCWGGQSASGAATQTTTPLPMAGGLSLRWLSSGATHGCAVTTQDAVYCWGNNSNGKLGVVGNGSARPIPAAGGLKAIEVMAAGIGTGSGAHTCAIAPDRLTVYCWGQNDVGQLGNGTYSTSTSANPTPSIVSGQKPLP